MLSFTADCSKKCVYLYSDFKYALKHHSKFKPVLRLYPPVPPPPPPCYLPSDPCLLIGCHLAQPSPAVTPSPLFSAVSISARAFLAGSGAAMSRAPAVGGGGGVGTGGGGGGAPPVLTVASQRLASPSVRQHSGHGRQIKMNIRNYKVSAHLFV